jgi:hypothetical protein
MLSTSPVPPPHTAHRKYWSSSGPRPRQPQHGLGAGEQVEIVSTQGHRLRWADLINTLIVEATIHYLDLTLDFPAPPAPASALLHARKVLDGLLGIALPLEWDDVEYALKGTGRVALTAADRDHFGDLALKIPLLG